MVWLDEFWSWMMQVTVSKKEEKGSSMPGQIQIQHMAPSMHLHRQVPQLSKHLWRMSVYLIFDEMWTSLLFWTGWLKKKKKKSHCPFFLWNQNFEFYSYHCFLLGTCLGPSTFPSLWWLSSTPWPTSPTSPPWPLKSCCPPTPWQWWAAFQLLQGQIFFFLIKGHFIFR